MKWLWVIVGIVLACATAPAMSANRLPASASAPTVPNEQDVSPSPQKSDTDAVQPAPPPYAVPNTNNAASGSSSGATEISGPYNPTLPASNSGSAAE